MASLEEVIRQRLAEATIKTETVVKAQIDEIAGYVSHNGDSIRVSGSGWQVGVKKNKDGKYDENDKDSMAYFKDLDSAKKFIDNGKKPVAEALISKDVKKEVESEEVGKSDEVEVDPKMKKKVVKESKVSSQVSALLEAEGLSDEFKVQAVTIFEAAVTDRVLVLEEELKKEFDAQLAEAKAGMNNDIDGFLSEAILQWKQDNEVAIKANFKSSLAESFMDDMQAVMAKHNVTLDEDKEDALNVALSEVDTLTESVANKEAELVALQEQVDALKGKQILESFKEKMTQVEFDRFTQLTESVKFADATQYEKQLTIVLENFGAKPKTEAVRAEVKIIAEEVADVTIVKEVNSSVNAYAQYLSTNKFR